MDNSNFRWDWFNFKFKFNTFFNLIFYGCFFRCHNPTINVHSNGFNSIHDPWRWRGYGENSWNSCGSIKTQNRFGECRYSIQVNSFFVNSFHYDAWNFIIMTQDLFFVCFHTRRQWFWYFSNIQTNSHSYWRD